MTPPRDPATSDAASPRRNPLSRLLTALIIGPIRLYQRFISPLRPPTCRFYPSCSAYAVKALQVHGPFVGSWLAVRRLGRCHPWTPGGVDHVPPRSQWRSIRPPYDPAEAEADDAIEQESAAPVEAGTEPSEGDEGTSTATRSRAPGARASSLTLRARWNSVRTPLRPLLTRDALRRLTPAPGA